MFERFSRSARVAVTEAASRAEVENAAGIGPEHLLAALLDSAAADSLLPRLGLTPQTATAVLGEIGTARRRGGLSAADAAALADLGIDLDAVVARIEADLGVGALEERGSGARRRFTGLPFSEAGKRVLESSLRQAVARGDRQLREEHLLLGLLAQHGSVADALNGHGVSAASVDAALRVCDPGPAGRAC